MKGPFADSKPRKRSHSTISVEVLTSSRNRDLRAAQISEIRKLLLRAAALGHPEASEEDAVDVAV